MDDLIKELENLRQWHLITAINRVNTKKKKRHYENAELLALSCLRIEKQQAKISELQAVIDEIMEIAHLGGLRNVDNEDALIAIRHLTKSRFEEIKGAWTSSHRTVDDQ